MAVARDRKHHLSTITWVCFCGSQTIWAEGGVRQQSKTAAYKKIACLGSQAGYFTDERIEVYGLHHILAAKFFVSEGNWMIGR